VREVPIAPSASELGAAFLNLLASAGFMVNVRRSFALMWRCAGAPRSQCIEELACSANIPEFITLEVGGFLVELPNVSFQPNNLAFFQVPHRL